MFSNQTFLENPSQWPSMRGGPKYCCLRRGNFLTGESGFILSSAPLEVCLGNIFDGGTGEYITYDSIEAIVADGWQVD